MKKIIALILAVICISCIFVGCGETPTETPKSKEEITKEASDVFAKAQDILCLYTFETAYEAFEAEFSNAKVGGDAIKDGDTKLALIEVEKIKYYLTNISYAEVEKKYAEVFTGSFLKNFMEKYFYEKDGLAYVLRDTAEDYSYDTENLSCTLTLEGEDSYEYKALYNIVEEDESRAAECIFTVKETAEGLRIVETNFLGSK